MKPGYTMFRFFIFKCRFVFLSAFFLFHACQALLADTEGAEVAPVDEAQVVFQCSKALDQAKSFLIRAEDRVREPSQWTGQYFDFGNLGDAHHIRILKGTFQGDEISGISLKPFKQSQKVIQWKRVPAGGTLIVNYGIEDSAVDAANVRNFYLRIWAGNHLLQRIRVAQEPGWKETRIPLNVVSFLKEPYFMTVDVLSDSDQSPSFFFDVRVVK